MNEIQRREVIAFKKRQMLVLEELSKCYEEVNKIANITTDSTEKLIQYVKELPNADRERLDDRMRKVTRANDEQSLATYAVIGKLDYMRAVLAKEIETLEQASITEE